MERNMSYRKPAPVYVPSPPPSPHQSTFTLSTHQNLDLEVPPLPPNWREVLDQVGMVPPRLNTTSSELFPMNTREHIEMDMSELPSSVMPRCPKGSDLIVHGDEVAIPGPTTRSTLNIPFPQKRRLHQQYRPPTPPIPSQHKHRQSLLNPDNLILISDDANSELTLTHNFHHRTDHFELYHDYPRGAPGATSLKISSSFRTGSFNTSMGWSQGTTGGLSNCPSLSHHRDLHKIAGDMAESVNPSCWGSLGAWAKKIRNLVIICK